MLIGLDIGTSSVKAVLFTEDGEVIKKCHRSYLFRGAEGMSELDPEQVRDAVFGVLRDVGEGQRGIEAIGISSLGEAAVLVDDEGRVICSTILPGDSRGTQEAEALKEDGELGRRSGLPVNSTYTACKLLWIREHRPEWFAKIRYVMLFGDFIGWCLTGERRISRSLASRTLAYDIDEERFFEPADGIRPEWFSQPVDAEECVGTLLYSIAEELGLDQGIKVYAGGHDQPCAALGAGVCRPGEAADSIGTSECITVCMGTERLHADVIRDTSFACEPFLRKNHYNTLAYTHTAGRLAEWYIKDILQQPKLYEELGGQCKAKPSQVLVLPHFSGSGTPYMDSMSVGAMIGLSLHTGRADIYQGILESVSYEMKLNLQLLKEQGIVCHKIVAVGGGAHSGEWLQMKADIYGLPIHTVHCGEASALGAAAVAASGQGIYRSIEDAAAAMVRYRKVIEPRHAVIPLYEEKYSQYRRLYGAIKDVMRGKE